jgi:hypothetical protein
VGLEISLTNLHVVESVIMNLQLAQNNEVCVRFSIQEAYILVKALQCILPIEKKASVQLDILWHLLNNLLVAGCDRR